MGKEILGWIDVSLEGFAQQNAARPLEHLVKELVQNSLDSIPTTGGEVSLKTAPAEDNITHYQRGTWIICQDNGSGIENIENIRTIFWTSKQDSHLKRGRMGRGFKELLCLSQEVYVESNGQNAHFTFSKAGERILKISNAGGKYESNGTLVKMLIPNPHNFVVDSLHQYFPKLLIGQNTQFMLEDTKIPHRPIAHKVGATLTTECFEGGKWLKPQRKTTIELVPLSRGESEGLIYEMGIPICPVEWDIPYHANICQRVPMNPNRDAVMVGFASKIHKWCLPYVLDELTAEGARSAWVGEAAFKSQDKTLQKRVLKRAFGNNLARSVPSFGKFDHDADAQEELGTKILDTKQLSGGFREMAKAHLPTSKELSKEAEQKTKEIASQNTVDLSNLSEKTDELVKRYGRKKIDTACQWYKLLADGILQELFGPTAPKCTVRLALMARTAEATWSNQGSILTLALDLERLWITPLNKENFSLIVHEVAHELAAHHGHSFANALEACAGAICKLFVNEDKALNSLLKTLKKNEIL
jgi:hypothetical protein